LSNDVAVASRVACGYSEGNRGADMSRWFEEHRMSHHHFGPLREPILRFAFIAAMFAATISVFLVSSNQLHAQPSRSTAQPVNPQELMRWLPADTESVVSASGPFLIPTGSNETSNENAPGWFTRKTTQAEIRAAFEELPLEVFYDLDLLSFTHNFLRDEESDLNVSEASESAP
jgi:hypothetical protein